MLFTRYLTLKFYKRFLFLSLLFTIFILTVQLFNSIHLVFALSLWKGVAYLLLNLVYTFFVGSAVALFFSLASLLYELKERRTVYVLYTFGISEKKVMTTLWSAVASVALAGLLSAPFVNYQKIVYVFKYMKALFGEQILLTIPPKSFFSEEDFAFFYTSKGGNRFENVVVKVGNDIATARRAILLPDGLLKLEQSSFFERDRDFVTWMESKTYTLSLGSAFSYTLSGKKLLKNTLFGMTLFLFPLAVFPLFFRLLLRSEGKFSSYGWAMLFAVLQFAVSLLIKTAV